MPLFRSLANDAYAGVWILCRTRLRRFGTAVCSVDVIATMGREPEFVQHHISAGLWKCKQRRESGGPELFSGFRPCIPGCGRTPGFQLGTRTPTSGKGGEKWGTPFLVFLFFLRFAAYPARRRAWVRWMVEMREMAATIVLERSCMVATSRSSKACGDEERTSKTPSVPR